jgi:hypothetical protein
MLRIPQRSKTCPTLRSKSPSRLLHGFETLKLRLDFQNLVIISCWWTILIDDIFALKENGLVDALFE